MMMKKMAAVEVGMRTLEFECFCSFFGGNATYLWCSDK
jgi:hypothetical protein